MKIRPAIGFLACAIVFHGCGREKPAEKPLTPVRVRAVETYEVGGGARYSANIVPYTQVDLTFKSGGYIQSILQVRGADGRMRNVQEGDRVAKDTVLAQVREDDYRDQVNGARAQLAKAQAVLDKARLDFERASSLFSTQSMTKPEYDGAKARFDVATADVKGAEASLAQVQTAFNDSALKAPMDAWVVKRSVEVGSLVGPSTVGFSLADTRLVKAIFGVPDLDVKSVRLGEMQTITTEAVPGESQGRVTAISPSADPKSRVFSVEITIPNPRNQLKTGMIASLTLAKGRLSKPVPVVPLSAVVRSSGSPDGYAVLLVEERGGKSFARTRNVELGEAYGNMIGVTKGVAPGERVIATGATLVKDGEPVQVIP